MGGTTGRPCELFHMLAEHGRVVSHGHFRVGTPLSRGRRVGLCAAASSRGSRLRIRVQLPGCGRHFAPIFRQASVVRNGRTMGERLLCAKKNPRLRRGFSGAKRARTADLLGAILALSQLSYGPATTPIVALSGGRVGGRRGAGRVAGALNLPPRIAFAISADSSRYQVPSSSSIAGRPLWPVPLITAVRPLRLGHDSLTTSYSTPASSSAFWTLQHGWRRTWPTCSRSDAA